MTKTFTCRELGGICDTPMTGGSLQEIMQHGGQHMMSDEAHKARMMNLSNDTGETREQWMTRMQAEFEARQED